MKSSNNPNNGNTVKSIIKPKTKIRLTINSIIVSLAFSSGVLIIPSFNIF